MLRPMGIALVIVVTGKGKTGADKSDWWDESERGILRRALPQWLSAPDCRALVVGYEQAHRRAGGEGAFYVQIRRRERGGR